MNEEIESSKFGEILLQQTPIIDVRAPIEFNSGSIPGSVNLPLLTDEERHAVGATYKQKGRDVAIELGHHLVSGEKRSSRIAQWAQFVSKNPNSVITCFRGGMRSKISQTWLTEAGFSRPRVQGGYKSFRRFLLRELERLSQREMFVVTGTTGSGKTLLIEEAEKFRPTIHLEKIAKHRGSVFGAYDEPQPSQSDFENQLTYCLLKQVARNEKSPIIIEDESRMIGHSVQPEKFFLNLRNSGVLLLDEPLEQRVQVIFDEYVGKILLERRAERFARYEVAIRIISKKLGGQRFQELLDDLQKATVATLETGDLELHKTWIEKLLVWYYDPLYLRSLAFRKPRIIFRGTRVETLNWLKTGVPKC